MRTTINLPDALIERAKRRAVEERLTLGQLIESALQDRLLRRQVASPPASFELVTFGRGGVRPGVSLDRLKELEYDEDIASILGARAAVALEHGCEWITTDADFARIPNLRWRHPLSR